MTNVGAVLDFYEEPLAPVLKNNMMTPKKNFTDSN
jgi:hypothetical protein